MHSTTCSKPSRGQTGEAYCFQFFCCTSMIMAKPHDEACFRLYFDPNGHPENTLKAFQEFIKRFQLWCDAFYPDPPKVSLEGVIERWKISQTSSENPPPKPNLEQFDDICEDIKARDKVTKFLGMYSWNRLYTDWYMAVPKEKARKIYKGEWICNSNDTILQTNRERYVKTLSILIKSTKRWWNIYSIL